MNSENKTKKFFNTAGLCFPDDHYMVDPLKRLREVESFIDQKFYFTLHAPRQTGKTTYLHTLARKLNLEGKYIALVVSFEQAGYNDISIEKANDILTDCIYRAALRYLPLQESPKKPDQVLSVKNYLEDWASSQTKSIVLFIDEIDALLDDVLISILRQLRDGYQSRPKFFPASVALVGLRDVRDYKIKVRDDKQSYGAASPFNIKSESLFLNNFSIEEVHELLEQHSQETGQVFSREAKDEIFRLTNGQPWLVNALAYHIVTRMLGNEYSREITFDLVSEAKNQLILRRDTHLDSLIDKLKEPRVKRIVQTIINGENLSFNVFDDDILYVRDLGIVSQTSPLKFSNPIYAEIIPRVMASPIQESIPDDIRTQWFVDKDGLLEMDKVLKEFQEFYRRNSESWLDRFEYRESAQHLLLMAFLQRVVNSGGEIVREMAVGNGRLDMLVKFKTQAIALELKIKRDRNSIPDGKKQLTRYLDRLGLSEGYLVVFDTGKKSWKEKLYFKHISEGNKRIIMVGL